MQVSRRGGWVATGVPLVENVAIMQVPGLTCIQGGIEVRVTTHEPKRSQATLPQFVIFADADEDTSLVEERPY